MRRAALLCLLALAAEASAGRPTGPTPARRRAPGRASPAAPTDLARALEPARAGLPGDLHLPAAATASPLSIERFPSSPHRWRSLKGPQRHGGHPLGPHGIDRARAAIERASGDLGRLRTAFYPAAGFDAGFAARLFHGADLIVGVDNHAFARPPFGGTMDVLEVDSESVTLQGDVERAGPLAPMVIGSLAGQVPGFRLRAVTAIREHSTAYALAGELVHGVVEFDSGEGTPVRRYVHVHGVMPPGVRPFGARSPWWWRALAGRRGEVGVIAKGAMNSLMGADVSELLADGGVLVSGLRDGRPELALAGHAAVEVALADGFGYDRDRVAVTVVRPAAEP